MLPRETQFCSRSVSRTARVQPISVKTIKKASTTPYTRMAMPCAVKWMGWTCVRACVYVYVCVGDSGRID